MTEKTVSELRSLWVSVIAWLSTIVQGSPGRGWIGDLMQKFGSPWNGWSPVLGGSEHRSRRRRLVSLGRRRVPFGVAEGGDEGVRPASLVRRGGSRPVTMLLGQR